MSTPCLRPVKRRPHLAAAVVVRVSGWPAVLVAIGLLVGCAAPRRAAVPAVDAELARLNRAARAAYDRASLTTAGTLYAQALTRARALDDAGAIGNAAYNLAVCRLAQGDTEPARALSDEAEAELARAGAPLAEVLLVEAKLARRQGRRDDAQWLAARVLSDPASAPEASHRLDVALVQGHLACDGGDAARAKVALEEATRWAGTVVEVVLEAARAHLAGRIDLLEKNPAGAAGHFDREAALHQRARQPRELAAALERAGEAGREAGQPAWAATRFYRAARSHAAQGASSAAQACLERAGDLAAQAGDEALQRRIRQLRAERADRREPTASPAR